MKKGSYLGGNTIIKVHPIGYGKAGTTVSRLDVQRESYDPKTARTEHLKAEDIKAEEEKHQEKERSRRKRAKNARTLLRIARKKASAEQRKRREEYLKKKRQRMAEDPDFAARQEHKKAKVQARRAVKGFVVEVVSRRRK